MNPQPYQEFLELQLAYKTATELLFAQLPPEVNPNSWILMGLIQDGFTTNDEISRKMETSTTYITGLLTNLTKHGYLKFKEGKSDRRVKNFTVTAKGRELMGRVK